MSRLGSFEVNKFSGYFDGCSMAKADKAQIYGRGDLTSSQADKIALKNAFDNRLGQVDSLQQPMVALQQLPSPVMPVFMGRGITTLPAPNNQRSMVDMLSNINVIIKQNSMTIIVIMLGIMLIRR